LGRLNQQKELKRFCINPNKNIVNKIKKNFPNNPVICFPKGLIKILIVVVPLLISVAYFTLAERKNFRGYSKT